METLVSNKQDIVLQYFLRHPTQVVHLRELSRKLKISFPWVRKLVLQFAKDQLLLLQKEGPLVQVRANRDNPLFLGLKRSYNLFSLYKCGLIEALVESYGHPEALILFGSYARGEDSETSDIDLAIISQKHPHLELLPFEKKLQRKIHLKELEKANINKEFLTTLANGLVLSGYLEL